MKVTAPYEVTAEFYDLLHAASYRASSSRLLGRWMGSPRHGVLDVGAGTGIVTELIAERCSQPIYAVEPAAPMRVALLTRLASNALLRQRVTVHAGRLQDLGLVGVADLAICLNVVPNLPSGERLGLFSALAGAVVPGGRLLLQRPYDHLPQPLEVLSAASLGTDQYGATVHCDQVGADRVQWRFTYQVRRDGTVVREERESFEGTLVSRPQVVAELGEAGFEVCDEDGDVLVGYRVPVRESIESLCERVEPPLQ